MAFIRAKMTYILQTQDTPEQVANYSPAEFKKAFEAGAIFMESITAHETFKTVSDLPEADIREYFKK